MLSSSRYLLTMRAILTYVILLPEGSWGLHMPLVPLCFSVVLPLSPDHQASGQTNHKKMRVRRHHGKNLGLGDGLPWVFSSLLLPHHFSPFSASLFCFPSYRMSSPVILSASISRMGTVNWGFPGPGMRPF